MHFTTIPNTGLIQANILKCVCQVNEQIHTQTDVSNLYARFKYATRLGNHKRNNLPQI